MTVVATPVVLPSGNRQSALGDIWSMFTTLTFSGNYATGGDALDPTPLFASGVGSILLMDISGGAGYGFEYNPTAKVLKVFSAPGTELAAGAYPAALTGDTNVVAQIYAK